MSPSPRRAGFGPGFLTSPWLPCLAILLLVSPFLRGQDPQPVPVGAGSYAEFPPQRLDNSRAEKIRDFLGKPLSIDDSLASEPVPSNHWFTHLFTHPFTGEIWALPLMASADASGLNVYLPKEWDKEGRAMVPGEPLRVTGALPNDPKAGQDILIADFETPTYRMGWTISGQAAGPGPAAGSLPGQGKVTGYLGSRLFNSMYPDDKSKGKLVSPEFTVARSYIHFLIGGGRIPDRLRFDLKVGPNVVKTATGDGTETLKWQTWDVQALKGQRAKLEAVDEASEPWGHLLLDQIVESDSPKPPNGVPDAFTPTGAKALKWGDWTFSFRLAQDASKFMDVTLARGIPYTWVQFHGIAPLLPEPHGGFTFFNLKGSTVTLPGVGDSLGIEAGGRCFAIFAPDNTVFSLERGALRAKFAGADSYLVVAALPDRSAIDAFRQHAFAMPQDSRLTWKYEPEKGQVNTHWVLQTRPLKGTNTDTFQGWIPHHYRDTNHTLRLTGLAYATPRGQLQCAVGHEFDIAFPFAGLLPTLPAPGSLPPSTDSPYNPKRMEECLGRFSNKTNYVDDTYWGGKDVLLFARYASMAAETHSPYKDVLQQHAKACLADWLTYSPGEEAHFFARYAKWKALVGFKDSYGSEFFNDQHFHYGYFTTAAALLGQYDQQFLKDYGPMLRLVAKEYANWDHDDKEFPFLRTFDVWEGHSWASGLSSPAGNNQESSSEAIQGWGGIFLLGSVLEDNAMLSAGAMGWAMETAATREYWFDCHAQKDPNLSNFSPAYGKKVTGILQAGGHAYATFFNGDSAWIYGIQWLPASPIQVHLGRDPEFSEWHFERMWEERKAQLTQAGKAAEIKSPEETIPTLGDLAWVLYGYTMQFKPAWTAAQLDHLWEKANPLSATPEIGLLYYMAQANQGLGEIRWNCHTSLPTSMVYLNRQTGKSTCVLYNPKATAQTVTVYKDGLPVTTLEVPPRTLTTASPAGL